MLFLINLVLRVACVRACLHWRLTMFSFLLFPPWIELPQFLHTCDRAVSTFSHVWLRLPKFCTCQHISNINQTKTLLWQHFFFVEIYNFKPLSLYRQASLFT